VIVPVGKAVIWRPPPDCVVGPNPAACALPAPRDPRRGFQGQHTDRAQ